MKRSLFLILVFVASLSCSAFAEEATDVPTPEISPIERSSNSVFDLLAPLIEARNFYENGQFEESYQSYSAVFLHDPDNIDVLFGLARSALKIGKNDIAVKAFIRLSKYDLKPGQALEQFAGLVLAETAAGTLENPEARLKQAIKITPNDHRLWNALGQFYDSQNRWDESKTAYGEAHLAGFSLAGLNNNIGMSYLAQKKYKIAEAYFHRARIANPNQVQFENNHRFSLLMQGKYNRALKNLASAQAGLILSDAGFIALQREEYLLARILLEKSIEVSPRYNEQAVRNLEILGSVDN
ncbi:tetratricopeptide repeat protein [Hellea balneolensis]|uniref:tetratricopeptide repeat protein n=1 Tax=Hellea balneolensis TaxID=287478 RepID=UPI0004095499|nr:hypothetical protein [Hellea balneolensis]